MIIKTTYGQLVPLQQIFMELGNKDFDFKRSVDIVRFLENQVNKEIGIFQKLRIQLCEKLAKKDESGKPVMTEGNYDIEDMQMFTAQYNALTGVEVELTFERPFTEKEFAGLTIKPAVLLFLSQLGILKLEEDEVNKREIPLKEDSNKDDKN